MKHFGIIANPVEHSISPRVYTEAFEADSIDATFEPIELDASGKDLEAFLDRMRGGAYDGLAVSHPFKEMCMTLVDEVDPVGREIGAINTIVREGRKLIGYNTDWCGVERAIRVALEQNRKKMTTLKWKKIVLLGAGGVARAAAYAFRKAGAHVFLVNRTAEKGREVAEKFEAEFVGGADHISDGLDPYDIIFQATSAGMSGDISPLPITFWENHGNGIAIESIYHPKMTRFLREAERAGWDIVTGNHLFEGQWEEQYRLFKAAF